LLLLSSSILSSAFPSDRYAVLRDPLSFPTRRSSDLAGGDAVTGPATVIRAVAAGKVGAANIDNFLDYNHTIRCDVEIPPARLSRSEEHTSELQSRFDLVCRLLLEKKKKRHIAADSNL